MSLSEEASVQSESGGCKAPDRLRWIADFLDVADKAISFVACVQGLDYPDQLHRAAQQDLRVWASLLDANPTLADDFDVARAVSAWKNGAPRESCE
jgi:hypothetical protein